MNAIIFSFLAAICSSSANLFFRKCIGEKDNRSLPNGYLAVFYFFSFLFSFALVPDIWNVPCDPIILSIGAVVGFLNVGLMLLTARALNAGPSGLTFAFQNASAVFPGMLLFLSFGTDFGFMFSPFQLIGICLVLIGLFVGAKNGSAQTSSHFSFKWLKYALACFVVQILALTVIQGRCILFAGDNGEGILATLARPSEMDVWFMPGLFGAALMLQTFLFFRDKRMLQKTETFYGFLGGLSNFGSTSLLLLATKTALPFEKGILFPCFAVGTILLSNIWANKLYKEKFNLASNSFCASGIFIGMIR